MDSQLFFVPESVSKDQFVAAIKKDGWTLWRQFPRRSTGPLMIEWTRNKNEGPAIQWFDHERLGVRYFIVRDIDPVPDWLLSFGRLFNAEQTLSEIKQCPTPAATIEKLSQLVVGTSPDCDESVLQCIVDHCCSEEPGVRWVSYLYTELLNEAPLLKFFELLFKRQDLPEDIAAPARDYHKRVEQFAKGEWIDDLFDRDNSSLSSIMHQAFSTKKWRRAEVASAMILHSDKPLRFLNAALVWANCQAQQDRIWAAWFAALVVSELLLLESEEKAADAINLRNELTPKLASQATEPTVHDLCPVLWLIKERWAHDEWPKAIQKVIPEVIAKAPGLEAEKALIKALMFAGDKEYNKAYDEAKTLCTILPNSVTSWSMAAHYSNDKVPLPERLHLFEELNRTLSLAEKDTAEPDKHHLDHRTHEFTKWTKGVVAEHARKPEDALREHIRALQQSGDLDGALAAADKALSYRNTALGWQDKAMILTAKKQHQDAIIAYTKAIELVDKDGMILLGGDYSVSWFNRACERAITGDHQGALEDLAEAIRKDEDNDHEWPKKAKADDYFNGLKNNRIFKKLCAGDVSALPQKVEIPTEPWDKLESRCKGLGYMARYTEAIEAGNMAITKATADFGENSPQVATCLASLGFALTWGGRAPEAIEALNRAIVIREKETPDAPELTEAYHHLGSALLHQGQLEKADEYYARALERREKAEGVESLVAAKSWGDRAGVSFEAGRHEEGVERLEKARDILIKRIAEMVENGCPEVDSTLIEARSDLLTVYSNLLICHNRKENSDQAMLAAQGVVTQAVIQKDEVNQRLRQSIAQNMKLLADREVPGALELLQAFADAVLPPQSPAERAAQIKWAGVRLMVYNLRQKQVPDSVIGQMLQDALRGDNIEPGLLKIEKVGDGISTFVSMVTSAQQGSLLATILALQTATSGGSLDEAIENIGAICVASAVEKAIAEEEKSKANGADTQPEGERDLSWVMWPFGNPYDEKDFNRRLNLDTDDYGGDDDDEEYDDEEDTDEEDEVEEEDE